MTAIIARIFILTALFLSLSTYGQDSKTALANNVAQTVTSQLPAFPKTVVVAVDLTGSFVDYILADGYMDRAVKRTMQELEKSIQKGSLVRVGVIGHSHHDESGSFEHLLAREWTVGGKYSKEKVVSGVRNWLRDIEADLRSKKLQKQVNTAVVMAFDRTAELMRRSNGNCMLIAISDLDDTEFGLPLPVPYSPGEFKGCEVLGLGAGVTLRGGTKAERELRQAWEVWFKLAGVDVARDFHWVPNP
jgi:hypothetical protein